MAFIRLLGASTTVHQMLCSHYHCVHLSSVRASGLTSFWALRLPQAYSTHSSLEVCANSSQASACSCHLSRSERNWPYVGYLHWLLIVAVTAYWQVANQKFTFAGDLLKFPSTCKILTSAECAQLVHILYCQAKHWRVTLPWYWDSLGISLTEDNWVIAYLSYGTSTWQ